MDFLKEHPELWDPTHKFYKNSAKSDQLWIDIANTIGYGCTGK